VLRLVRQYCRISPTSAYSIPPSIRTSTRNPTYTPCPTSGMKSTVSAVTASTVPLTATFRQRRASSWDSTTTKRKSFPAT
jgi:hypothetical protein